MNRLIEVVKEVPTDRYHELGLTDEKLRWMLRKMLEARRFEEMVERLFLVEGLSLIHISEPTRPY